MSAWHWLKAELVRRLGEDEAGALWAEYRARARLDLDAAQAQQHRRRWNERRDPRARAWLEERGYTLD